MGDVRGLWPIWLALSCAPVPQPSSQVPEAGSGPGPLQVRPQEEAAPVVESAAIEAPVAQVESLEAEASSQAGADSETVEVPEVSEKISKRILAVQELVRANSTKHGVDPALLNGMIWVESKFDPKARGPAGAMGLMQLMPKTAKSLAGRLERKSRPYDPDFNIDAGALYLARLLRRFEGDERLALAAYNRGVGRVAGWVEAGEDIPERTQGYVDRVLAARAWLPLFVQEQTRADTDEEGGGGRPNSSP